MSDRVCGRGRDGQTGWNDDDDGQMLRMMMMMIGGGQVVPSVGGFL